MEYNLKNNQETETLSKERSTTSILDIRKLQHKRGDLVLQIEQVAQFNINELAVSILGDR